MNIVKTFTASIKRSDGEVKYAVVAVDFRNRCYLLNHRSNSLAEHSQLMTKVQAKGEAKLDHWQELTNLGNAMTGAVEFETSPWHVFEHNVVLDCKHPTSFEDRCTSCSQWIN